MDWIQLAQERESWYPLANITVEFHKMWGIPRTSEQLSASQEVRRYTELLYNSSPQFSSVTPKFQSLTRNRQDVVPLHCPSGKAVSVNSHCLLPQSYDTHMGTLRRKNGSCCSRRCTKTPAYFKRTKQPCANIATIEQQKTHLCTPIFSHSCIDITRIYGAGHNLGL